MAGSVILASGMVIFEDVLRTEAVAADRIRTNPVRQPILSQEAIQSWGGGTLNWEACAEDSRCWRYPTSFQKEMDQMYIC